MGLRRQTEGERTHLPGLSRRAVLAGTSAAALSAPQPWLALAAAMPASAAPLSTRPYKRWLRLDAKIERLQTRWAKLESWLARDYSWLQLSSAEQQALPAAQELRNIDSCLDVLFAQRDILLEVLPARGATTLEEVVARLRVVERLVPSCDHPEAHGMIAGSRQDLIGLMTGIR